MFHSVGRILQWAKGYRKRMILGFVCSFFATWCTAGPVMLAAWTLGRMKMCIRDRDNTEYYAKRKARDDEARAAYRAELENDDLNGLYMRDILREELTPDDPRLR